MPNNNGNCFDPGIPGCFSEPTYCVKYFRGVTGPTGPTGPQGPTGPTGATGQAGTLGATGATGAQGLPGLQGPAGLAATIEVLRTITGEPGSAAAVLNSGTESDATLTFVIPAGVQGVRGLPGERGEA
ncbi:MAG: collagen-like protein, partial [Oscillospiraceae bacterium]|nr:collagen-like protein [Oscillospiraceae bacterium]